jgi:hypothetical protein
MMEKWKCKSNPKKKVFVLDKTIGRVGTVYEGKRIFIIRDTYDLKGTLRLLFFILLGLFTITMSIKTRTGNVRLVWIFTTVAILYTVHLEHKYITRRVVLEDMFKKDYIKECVQHNILFEFFVQFKKNVERFFKE